MIRPLSLQRDGFIISGEHVAIDRNNPRFSETDGERLFDATVLRLFVRGTCSLPTR